MEKMDARQELEAKIEELNATCVSERYVDNEHYNYLIDDRYPDVSIGGCTWTASQVLFEMDPICYSVGFNDYTSDQISDLEYELESME